MLICSSTSKTQNLHFDGMKVIAIYNENYCHLCIYDAHIMFYMLWKQKNLRLRVL